MVKRESWGDGACFGVRVSRPEGVGTFGPKQETSREETAPRSATELGALVAAWS